MPKKDKRPIVGRGHIEAVVKHRAHDENIMDTIIGHTKRQRSSRF